LSEIYLFTYEIQLWVLSSLCLFTYIELFKFRRWCE